jgi:cysteine synthase B
MKSEPARSVLDLVGGTPLVEIRRVGRERISKEVRVLAKLEGTNPGGSVKDRPALAMVRDGERTGRLRKGKTILDATSGNTGIALAWIGAALEYPVTLCVPRNASRERLAILRAHGAELVLTDPREATDGAQRECRRLVEKDPDRYFYCDQYGNDANWRAHEETTAREIVEQTGGRVTHFVAGLGTSGTFIGTSRGLRRAVPGVRCVSFQPDSPFHGLEGLKHMASALVPRIYDPRRRRRGPRVLDRARARDGPGPGAGGRALRRGLLGGGARRRARRRVGDRVRHGRHRVPRRRIEVPLRAVLGGGHRLAGERRGSRVKTVMAPSVEREIRRHGESTYPHECCGLLLGTLDGETRRVTATFEIGNAREESARHNRYLIGPDDYLRGEKSAREKGLDVLGFYHSHPDHPARPSEFDRDHAWPFYAYVIVAVAKGRSEAIGAFRLSDDRARLDPEPLEIAAGGGATELPPATEPESPDS